MRIITFGTFRSLKTLGIDNSPFELIITKSLEFMKLYVEEFDELIKNHNKINPLLLIDDKLKKSILLMTDRHVGLILEILNKIY